MAMEDGCSYDSTNKMKIRQMIGVHSTVGIDLKSINVIPRQKEDKKMKRAWLSTPTIAYDLRNELKIWSELVEYIVNLYFIS